jgi:dipeptidyl aminopeptidase/acylaminoacyl peptidase
VPHQQTLILADALRAHGTPVVLHILQDGLHGDRRFEDELAQPAIDWMDQLRKPQWSG